MTLDADGRRNNLTAATHTGGDCNGAPAVTSSSRSFDSYDTADRPTTGQDTGQGGTGAYVYDTLGRQTAAEQGAVTLAQQRVTRVLVRPMGAVPA